jgi:hypothetical protein
MPNKKRSRKQKVTDLAPKALGRKEALKAESVRGGRAGGDKTKYMVVKMNDVFIS